MPKGIYKHHQCQGFQKGNKFGKTNKGRERPDMAGKNNPKWKGGKYQQTKDGRWYVRKLNHPFAYSNGYVRRARLVAEKYLGRYLTSQEEVHHINGIKSDDRPENLYVFFKAKHTQFHFLKDKPILKSNLLNS